MPRNITVTFSDGSTHVYQGAPDDITPDQVAERAEADFGLEVVSLDGGRGGGKPRHEAPPNATPTQDARLVIADLFPGARITDWKRDPNSDLGRANPSSWHTRSGAAIDMAPIPGMSYEDAVKRFEDAGYVMIEAIDEVKNPSGHATGPHWHFVVGIPPGGLQPKGQEEPDALEGDDPGLEVTVTDDSPPKPVPTDPHPEGSGFFGLPSLDQIGKGLEYGTGAIVEGLGDTVGIVANPLATMLGRGLGYENYTADLGGDLRDGLGLDRPTDTANRITGDVISGVAGGAGFSGGARLGARAVQHTLTQKALRELGATPVRDAVAGGTAALAGDAAEAAGAGATGQMVAALAGGAAGYGAGGAAKALGPEARATRFANNQAAKNPAAAYDAEIVQDLVKARQTLDRSKTDTKARAPLDVKAINSVMNGYTVQMKTLIGKLDLPEMDKVRYRSAIERKHSLPQDEIDALRGSVAGDAVADAIIKTQRLKRLTPEIARNKSLLTRTGEAASAVTDMLPIPGYVGRSIRWSTKAAAGDAEAARVHAAERLLAKQRGYEKLGQKVGPSGQRESQQALWDAAGNTISAKQAAAAKAALDRQNAKAAAQKLRADNNRVGVKNDLDDIKPGGGFRGHIYEKLGLLPSQQDVGALTALSQGKITPEQFDAFLKSPDKLMAGNAGNALVDRFGAMVDQGQLKPDPKWEPPKPATTEAPSAAPMVDAQGDPIRSMPAYQGGIAKNIARQLELERQLDEIDPIRTEFADGTFVRDSEAGLLDEATLAKANAIRAQLAAMTQPKPKN